MEGRPDFRQLKYGRKCYPGEPRLAEGLMRIRNEYYSCDTGAFYRILGKKPGDEIRYFILFKNYRPNSAAKSDHPIIRGEGYYVAGNYKVNAEGTDVSHYVSADTLFSFDRIGKDYMIIYTFPSYIKRDYQLLASCVIMQEGFEFDYEGRPTPIVRNVSRDYYKKHLDKYSQIKATVACPFTPERKTLADVLSEIKMEIVSTGSGIKF